MVFFLVPHEMAYFVWKKKKNQVKVAFFNALVLNLSEQSRSHIL